MRAMKIVLLGSVIMMVLALMSCSDDSRATTDVRMHLKAASRIHYVRNFSKE